MEDAHQWPLARLDRQWPTVEQMPALTGAIQRCEQGSAALGELELHASPVLLEADQVAVVPSSEGAPGEAEVDGLEQVRLPRPVVAVDDDDRRRQRGLRICEVAEPPALECADDHGSSPTRSGESASPGS